MSMGLHVSGEPLHKLLREAGAADRDEVQGANHSSSIAIARICNAGGRPSPKMHATHEVIQRLPGSS